MKVLITGAGGQVGRALLKTVPPDVAAIGVRHGELDITDERSVNQSIQRHQPEVIINAAAYTAVDRAEDDAESARRVNALAPGILASAARQSGARLVHISTDYVFDGLSSTPYRPDARTNPMGVYGLTKRAGEEAVLQQLPEQSVILRTAWVYAAEGSNFLRTMLRLMSANKSVRVVSDQVGSPTSAAVVADGIWQIVAQPALRGIHHWTNAGVASWYDFAVAIAEDAAQLGLLSAGVTVTPIMTHEYPTKARRPAFSVLDRGSLASLPVQPVHWRTSLRAVLGEIARA